MPLDAWRGNSMAIPTKLNLTVEMKFCSNEQYTSIAILIKK